VIARLLVVGLLLGHGLIHAAYVAPRPPLTAGGPQWPFELSHSWLLGSFGVASDAGRIVGLALVAVTIAGFALASVAALGLAPAGVWIAGVVVGAIASLALLVLFFHPWLVLGVAIDVILLWAVLAIRWVPDNLTS
jgi:hypothetical protein